MTECSSYFMTSPKGPRKNYLVHSKDDDSAAPAISEHARDHLEAAGYKVTLRTFQAGPTVPDGQLEQAAQWLRGPAPAK